jgi:hypothetical protein
MKVLFWGLTSFFLSFMIHLIIWRKHVPLKQTKALLFIYFGTLVIILSGLWSNLLLSSRFASFAATNVLEYFQIFILTSSLIFSYIITYSAIEADSPSLLIVREVADAGPDGLNEEKLKAILNNDFLIAPRLRDLITDKMVYAQGDKYRLTFKGFLIAKIFVLSRELLNAPKGG